jgi:hypothetical protein
LITSPLATPFSPIPSSPSLKKNQESYSKNPIGKSWTGVHPVYSLIQIFRRLKAIVINQKWIIYLLSLISKETLCMPCCNYWFPMFFEVSSSIHLRRQQDVYGIWFEDKWLGT